MTIVLKQILKQITISLHNYLTNYSISTKCIRCNRKWLLRQPVIFMLKDRKAMLYLRIEIYNYSRRKPKKKYSKTASCNHLVEIDCNIKKINLHTCAEVQYVADYTLNFLQHIFLHLNLQYLCFSIIHISWFVEKESTMQ